MATEGFFNGLLAGKSSVAPRARLWVGGKARGRDVVDPSATEAEPSQRPTDVFGCRRSFRLSLQATLVANRTLTWRIRSIQEQ